MVPVVVFSCVVVCACVVCMRVLVACMRGVVVRVCVLVVMSLVMLRVCVVVMSVCVVLCLCVSVVRGVVAGGRSCPLLFATIQQTANDEQEDEGEPEEQRGDDDDFQLVLPNNWEGNRREEGELKSGPTRSSLASFGHCREGQLRTSTLETNRRKTGQWSV